MRRSTQTSGSSACAPSTRCAHARTRGARACATSERNVKDVKAGFRWDPAMSRWIRDDKMVGFDAPVEIKPKSGAAYTVRTSRGLANALAAPLDLFAIRAALYSVGILNANTTVQNMQVWPVMHTDLTDYGLTSYPPAKVRKSRVSLGCAYKIRRRPDGCHQTVGPRFAPEPLAARAGASSNAHLRAGM